MASLQLHAKEQALLDQAALLSYHITGLTGTKAYTTHNCPDCFSVELPSMFLKTCMCQTGVPDSLPVMSDAVPFMQVLTSLGRRTYSKSLVVEKQHRRVSPGLLALMSTL